MIVTFCGLFLRPVGGWIAVADLINLLELTGQSSTATRQALVRLKSRDFLSSQKQDGRAGYTLTAAGLADLAVGDSRIFRHGVAAESDGWVLAVFSVPEHARAQRHRLRSNLSWLGFGTVGPGVWIAPAALTERARTFLDGEGLGGYVTWFVGRSVEVADVANWWDLGALRELYSQFLGHWSRAAEAVDGRSAFVNYLALVDDWRQFPRIDPGLPAALLPPDWQGRRAFGLFTDLRQKWSEPASEFVRKTLGEGVSP